MAKEKHSIDITLSATDHISSVLKNYTSSFNDLTKTVEETGKKLGDLENPAKSVGGTLHDSARKIDELERRLREANGGYASQAPRGSARAGSSAEVAGAPGLILWGSGGPGGPGHNAGAYAQPGSGVPGLVPVGTSGPRYIPHPDGYDRYDRPGFYEQHKGKIIAGAAGAAGGALAGKKVIETGAGYEAAIQQVLAFVGDAHESGNQEKLEDAIRAEAKRLPGYLPSEVAGSATKAGSEGYLTDKIIESLPTLLEFAIAGRYQSVSEGTSDMLTVLGGFNKGSEEIRTAADKVVDITSRTKTSMQLVAESMTGWASDAHLSGIDLSAALALTGGLAKSGLTGSPAATGLKNMIRAIQNKVGEKNKQVIPIYKKAGFEEGEVLSPDATAGQIYRNDKGEITGNRIFDTLEKLMAADLTPAEISRIFDEEGADAFKKLKTFGIDEIRKIYIDNLNKSEASLVKRVETLNKGAIPAFKELQSAIEDTQISMSKSGLLTAATYAARAGTHLIDAGDGKLLPLFTGAVASAAAGITAAVVAGTTAAIAPVMVPGLLLTTAGIYSDEIKNYFNLEGSKEALSKSNGFSPLSMMSIPPQEDRLLGFQDAEKPPEVIEQRAVLKIEFANPEDVPSGTTLKVESSPEFPIDFRNGPDLGGF